MLIRIVEKGSTENVFEDADGWFETGESWVTVTFKGGLKIHYNKDEVLRIEEEPAE